MDVPPICQIAEERIAAASLTGRCMAVPADLIQGPYPSGADVITLGWILHEVQVMRLEMTRDVIVAKKP
jgi:hypothetical protein